MAAYVAQTKEKLRDSTSNKNPNYPEGVKDTEVSTITYHIGMSTVEQFIWVNLYSLDFTLLFPSQDLETFEKECTYLKAGGIKAIFLKYFRNL